MLSTLVLTAGIGTRLDPITRVIAKPAVPVAGLTLVERVLKWLHREGVRDVVLNLHHRPETITRVVGDGAHLGLRARYSWEQPLLGSAGGPRHALGLIDAGSFLIVNGDTLCDFALGPMLDGHRRNGADVTMALVPNPAPDHYNGVVLDDTDGVIGFVPKGQAVGSWHFVGVQVASAGVFASLPDGTPAETVSGIYRDAVASGRLKICGYRAPTVFLDVGTPADYLAAARQLSSAPDGRSVEAGAQVDPSAVTGRSIVWADATVGAGAVLDECIAAGGVHVPARFAATRAVLLPATAYRPGDRAQLSDGIAVYPL